MPNGQVTPPACLKIRDVQVERAGYPLLSIEALDLSISNGVTALIGPNGAGKTTLLRLLQGLISPDSGSLSWPNNAPPHRAILLQNPVLLRRNVSANLAFVLDRENLSTSVKQERLASLLAAASLSGSENVPARRLSGGQKRRLALAQALARSPKMLLLDEPTAGLDPAAASAVEKMIADIARQGTCIIVSSHDIGQVRRLADHALFLRQGKIEESGPLPLLFEAPDTTSLKAFLTGDLTW